MIQVATSPATLAGTPGDLLVAAGDQLPQWTPTTADLFRLDPRLASKVDAAAEGGCWLWTGAVVHAGNGRIPYGRVWRQGRAQLAHRWAFTLMVGPIPDGYDLHHHCSTPLCINPAHLEALHPDDHDWFHREVAACDGREQRLRALIELTIPPRRTR